MVDWSSGKISNTVVFVKRFFISHSFQTSFGVLGLRREARPRALVKFTFHAVAHEVILFTDRRSMNLTQICIIFGVS